MLKDYEKTQKYYKNSRANIYQKLKPFQEFAIKNATKLGRFDFENIYSAKSEIFKVLELLK